ncbi:MAG: hypothetical protein AB7T63_09155 [Planctomycetota bacterium]
MIWLFGLLLVVVGGLGPVLVHIRRHDFPNARRRRREAVAAAEADVQRTAAAVAARPDDGAASGPVAPVRRRWNPHPASPTWWAHLIFAGLIFAWFRVVFGNVLGATIGTVVVLLILVLWPKGRRRHRPERFRRGRRGKLPDAVRKTIEETF